jgi:hypothetical protein
LAVITEASVALGDCGGDAVLGGVGHALLEVRLVAWSKAARRHPRVEVLANRRIGLRQALA